MVDSKKSLPIFFFAFLFLFISNTSSEALAFSQKNKYYEVRMLFDSGRYLEIYRIHLKEIPTFHKFSRYSEDLFYYFAWTCIELGYFDEAEGYLYTIKEELGEPRDPERFDYIWALLFDKKENWEEAYRRYTFFVHLYPDNVRAPGAIYRLAKISQANGRFRTAREFFQKIVNEYPASWEAQQVNDTDDIRLNSFFLVFGIFSDLDTLRGKIKEMQKDSLHVQVFRTILNNQKVFLLSYGDYANQKDTLLDLKKFREMGYPVTLYPEVIGFNRDFKSKLFLEESTFQDRETLYEIS